jgi:hypothetical protein
MNIDISKLDKAEVLAALYNNSKQQGLGFLDVSGKSPMTKEDAQNLLSQQDYFDYLRGRVMKVDLKGDSFSPHLYDRDNGTGAAERALQPLFNQ